MNAKSLLIPILSLCFLCSYSAEGGVKQRGMGCSDVAVALDSFSSAKNPALTTGKMRYECNVFIQESVYFDRDAFLLGEAALSLPITGQTACTLGVVSLGTLAFPEIWTEDVFSVGLEQFSPATQEGSAKLFCALSHWVTPDHAVGISFNHYRSAWKEEEYWEASGLFEEEREQTFMAFGFSLGYWGRVSPRLSLGISADSGALFDYRKSEKEKDYVVLANPEIRVGVGYQATDSTLCTMSLLQSIPREGDENFIYDIPETNLLFGVEQRMSSWFVLRGGYRLSIAGRVPTLAHKERAGRTLAMPDDFKTKLQSTFSVGASCSLKGIEISLFAALANTVNAGFQCGYVF